LKPLGSRLDQESMKHDPFYALHELFSFSASAGNQFLNFIAVQVNAADQSFTNQASIQKSLDTLLYHDNILQDYISYLRGLTVFLRDYHKTSWGNLAKMDSNATADKAAERLQRSFEHLHIYASSIFARGQDKINNIRSTVVIEESRRAFDQQQSVAKLTRLAFFFIPASFVTSFFGMNFQQLGGGTLPLWIFFVAFGTFLLLSMLVLYWNDLVRRLWRLVRR